MKKRALSLLKPMLVLLALIIMFRGCVPEEIETPEDNKKTEILKEKIEKAVTAEVVAQLKKLGMPIHDGIQPPDIEGSYLADDITLKVCNIDDYDPIGTKYINEKWTFKNQDNERFSVSMMIEYENESTPDSYNMIISGSGEKFTLYSGQTGISKEGNAYRIVNIYSGTKTDDGLGNVHLAIFWIEESYDDLVLIYHEQDGIAKKFDGTLGPEKPEAGEKAGNVKLPQGAKIDFEKYSVITFADKRKVGKTGNFVVGLDESEQLQQTVFMADENNRVLMLSYLNVGVEKIELSAESSAVGIFMMLTGVRSQLDKEQWARTEELLKKTPKFAPVLAEVERLIKAEADLLSENNTQLIKLYGDLLESMAQSSTKSVEAMSSVSQPFTQFSSQGSYESFSPTTFQTRAADDKKDTSLPPLVITNKGNRIIFNSDGMAPAYLITIEEEGENGKRQEVLRETLGVCKAVNLGIGDILTWQWGFFQPPGDNVEYTMKTNTNYYISANSGLGELNAASFNNLGTAVLYLADIIGWKLGSNCVQAVVEHCYNDIKFAVDAYKSEGFRAGASLAINRIVGAFTSGKMIDCVLGEGAAEMASKATQFMLKSVDVMGKADGYGSLFGHFFFWFESESIIDFCRSTDGMDMNECGISNLTITTPLSAGTQVHFKCDRHACVLPAWIDLNGNDKKDPGEELKDGDNYVTLQRQEMKIHGDFAQLNFDDMELTRIQLNKNTQVSLISAEKLKEFHAGECQHLLSLFTGTKLEKVDVRNCKELKTFSTRGKIKELDLTGCKALEKIYCSKGELTTLNLKGLKNLKEVDCYSNNLTSVQLGENPALMKIDLQYNRLTASTITEILKSLPQRGKEDGAVIRLDGNTGTPSGDDYTIAKVKNWRVTPAAGKITFATAKPVGSTIRLKVTAQETNPYDVWVDLNGNGELDEGESFSAYNTPQEFKIARDTVTIHGGLLKVDCSNNEITKLEVKDCPTLQELRCNKNKIEELSMNDLYELKLLDCSDNLLKSLKVSFRNKLTELYCKNNPVTEVEVIKCEKLEVLDVSNCASLTKLNCKENNLKTLTLTGCNALKTVNCDYNSLTTLNISGISALAKLECRNNELDASAIIGIIGNLPQRAESDNASAHFENNQAVPTKEDIQTGKAKNWIITPVQGEDPLPNEDVIVLTLDKHGGSGTIGAFIKHLSGTEDKIWMDLNGNGIKDKGEEVRNVGGARMVGVPTVQTIKIYGASFITELNFAENLAVKPTSLDLRKCTVLEKLDADKQALTSLQVNGCDALKDISVDYNQLTYLNVTGCPSLEKISVISNKLTELNASGLSKLTVIRWSREDISKLILSNCTSMKKISLGVNSGMTYLDVTGCTGLEELSCSYGKLVTLKAAGCTSLLYLMCINNELTHLNIAGCTSLRTLDCNRNKLTSLDVSGLTALKILICSENELTSLNLAGCMALKELTCNQNKLSGVVPPIFEQLSYRNYDIRYEYTWDSNQKKYVVKKDNQIGYWYSHEPGGGCHKPDPCNK